MGKNAGSQTAERFKTCVTFGWGVMRCNQWRWILITLMLFIPLNGFSLVMPAFVSVLVTKRFMEMPGAGSSIRALPISRNDVARVFWVLSVILAPVAWFLIQTIKHVLLDGGRTYPFLFLAKSTLATMGFTSLCYIYYVLPLSTGIKSPYTKTLGDSPILAVTLLLVTQFKRIEDWFGRPIIWLVLAVAAGLTVAAYGLPLYIMRGGEKRKRAARPETGKIGPLGGLPWRSKRLGAWGVPASACCLTLLYFSFGFMYLLYIYITNIKQDAFPGYIVLFLLTSAAGLHFMNTWRKAVMALRALPLGPNRLVRFYLMLIAPGAGLLLCGALAAYTFGTRLALPFAQCTAAYMLWIPLLCSLSLRFGKNGVFLVTLSVSACFFAPRFMFGPVEITSWALIGIVGWLYLRYSLIHNSVIYRSPGNL